MARIRKFTQCEDFNNSYKEIKALLVKSNILKQRIEGSVKTNFALCRVRMMMWLQSNQLCEKELSDSLAHLCVQWMPVKS